MESFRNCRASAQFVVATNCPGYDGEGITYAPASPRGRIACSGDGVRAEIFVPPVLLLAALAHVVWVVGWILRSRLRWFCAALALLLLAPVGVLAALGTLPADCSKDQWAEHGVEGCERDREAR